MRSEIEIAEHLGELKQMLVQREAEKDHEAALIIAAKIDLLMWVLGEGGDER